MVVHRAQSRILAKLLTAVYLKHTGHQPIDTAERRLSWTRGVGDNMVVSSWCLRRRTGERRFIRSRTLVRGLHRAFPPRPSWLA